MTVEVGAAIAALDELASRIDKETERAVFEAAAELDAAAKALAPSLTGTLRRSIRIEGPRRAGLGAYRAKVGPTVIYGRQRELGGHIVPVRAKMLRWPGPGDPRGQFGPIFARHVYQRPHPYLKPATLALRSRFRDIAAKHWAAAVRSV